MLWTCSKLPSLHLQNSSQHTAIEKQESQTREQEVEKVNEQEQKQRRKYDQHRASGTQLLSDDGPNGSPELYLEEVHQIEEIAEVQEVIEEQVQEKARQEKEV